MSLLEHWSADPVNNKKVKKTTLLQIHMSITHLVMHSCKAEVMRGPYTLLTILWSADKLLTRPTLLHVIVNCLVNCLYSQLSNDTNSQLSMQWYLQSAVQSYQVISSPLTGHLLVSIVRSLVTFSQVSRHLSSQPSCRICILKKATVLQRCSTLSLPSLKM